MRRRTVQRALALDMRQWLLLGEALVALAAASAAINMLPFRRVVRIAARKRPMAKSPRARRFPPSDVLWAVQAVSWRVPWRTVCFQKGLALHVMLQRRGICSRLHYGVGRGEKNELAAHVWVSVDGQIILGGDVAERFQCLATYPADC